ncbi:hypothetical protein CM49_02695 [Paenibacillus sp. P1XP2]|nr:hypothetical protein CM49_02695 [Paenibacillus sp. P1XP2]
MISIRLQICLIIGSIICFLVLVNLIKKYRMELRYSMLWILIMVLILFLSIFPNSIHFVSNLMGIELPVNALFFLTIFGLIVIMFSLTLEVSKMNMKIKELSQELGLTKHALESISGFSKDIRGGVNNIDAKKSNDS